MNCDSLPINVSKISLTMFARLILQVEFFYRSNAAKILISDKLSSFEVSWTNCIDIQRHIDPLSANSESFIKQLNLSDRAAIIAAASSTLLHPN